MNFSGARVLITGASSGIGLEFARQLHSRGANVVLLARRKALLEKYCAEFNAQRPDSAIALPADLTCSDGLSAVLRYIGETRIDILINNAGRGSFGYFHSSNISEEIALVKLNIEAPLRLTRVVLEQMKDRKSGAIVSVSSIAGIQPLPYMATYGATKAFELFHSMALRQELKEFGVRVVTVCPGPTETEFFGVARVPGTATGGRRDPVETVVSQSLRALVKNRPLVVTGFRSKLMALGSRLAPKELSSWAVKKMLHSALMSKYKSL
jgi:short-subunit dehydrogenase